LFKVIKLSKQQSTIVIKFAACKLKRKTYEQYQKNNYANFVTSGDKAFVAIKFMNGWRAIVLYTNISIETRAQSNFVINHIKVDTMRSEDGTVKNAVCYMMV
jgi:hypothetical protein